jgi:hypothetical protein
MPALSWLPETDAKKKCAAGVETEKAADFVSAA